MPSFDKEQYRQICRNREQDIPVFMQDWYLDIVCSNGEWNAAIAMKGDKVAGIMPYYLKKQGFFTFVTLPPMTKMMGAFVMPECRDLKTEHKILDRLIDQLPNNIHYYCQYHPYTITNWLPFLWRGFGQRTYYSYIINDITDLDKVWSNLYGDYRTKIRKAENIVEVRNDLTIEDFYKVHEMTFERQKIKFAYSLEFIKQCDTAFANHNCRKMFFAIDKEKNIHSVCYLVWDKNTAYYIMAGDNPDLRNSNAGILLKWEAIKYAHNLGLKNFDFTGSISQRLERVNRQFGAEQVPYFILYKYYSNVFRFAKIIKDFIKYRTIIDF